MSVGYGYKVIDKSLKYIEKNLCELLTLERIANHSGYSQYYFARLFKRYMGLSVMDYVKDRRLIKASECIMSGDSIIDAALSYGYLSHSGFTKAFKCKYGFSPSLLKAIKVNIDFLSGGNSNMSHAFLKKAPIHANKDELYCLLEESLKENKVRYDVDDLNKAYLFACNAYEGILRYSKDEYITHTINVAIILQKWKLILMLL